MRKIIAIIDYKSHFGSKHFDLPYRSGMDKLLLKECFEKLGCSIDYIKFTELLQQKEIVKDAFYIYTSSEDVDYHYKSFIEDIVLFLQESDCKVIPEYKYLRANNNKVFMELLRQSTKDDALQSIKSAVFGTMEEAMEILKNLQFPVVIKKAEGASGTGVFKADNANTYERLVRRISATKNLILDIKEIGRTFKHNGYIKESKFRSKFIVQNMIQGLVNDWKVYYFMDKLYVFYRPILKHRDFKASGGGYDNYQYGLDAKAPQGLFDFVERTLQYFKVPHASLDIAFDGNSFHLIEMQFLYFGTAGIPYSDGYFKKENSKWVFVNKKLSIEEVYATSIADFIS
jgi:hypothetical protein